MLAIRGLQVRYGAIAAVRGIDLDINAGEIVALLVPMARERAPSRGPSPGCCRSKATSSMKATN